MFKKEETFCIETNNKLETQTFLKRTENTLTVNFFKFQYKFI